MIHQCHTLERPCSFYRAKMVEIRDTVAPSEVLSQLVNYIDMRAYSSASHYCSAI